MKTVLVAAGISAGFQHFLEERNYVLTSDHRKDVEGIITSNKLVLDQKTIDSFPELKWIARLGSGMEIIDTAYCEQQNIHCFSSPCGIANAVAEHALGMLLSLYHHIKRSQDEIRSGAWLREKNRGVELENQCIGLIGYGHTGSALANKLQVFTEHILAYDKYKTGFGTKGVKEVTLQQIFDEADIISFHVPLTDETRYYYDDTFLANMKKKHVVLNTSRGEVCSTDTILHGLSNGRITGACLDVLEEERNMSNILSQKGNNVEQLLQFNTILTPHIAGYSFNAIEKMSLELQIQLEKLLL